MTVAWKTDQIVGDATPYIPSGWKAFFPGGLICTAPEVGRPWIHHIIAVRPDNIVESIICSTDRDFIERESKRISNFLPGYRWADARPLSEGE